MAFYNLAFWIRRSNPARPTPPQTKNKKCLIKFFAGDDVLCEIRLLELLDFRNLTRHNMVNNVDASAVLLIIRMEVVILQSIFHFSFYSLLRGL